MISADPNGRPAVPIEDAVVDRTIKPRKRGSKVGFVIDPFRRRKLPIDSGLEEAALTVLIANPDVLALTVQQAARYMAGGRPHVHFFDAVADYRGGCKKAFAVKPKKQVKKSDVETVLADVAAHLGDRFADEYLVVTEDHLDAITVGNAELVCSCGRDFDFEAQRAARDALRGFGSEATLREIGGRVCDGPRGYRAAVTLIQQGLLVPAAGRLIGPDNVVRILRPERGEGPR